MPQNYLSYNSDEKTLKTAKEPPFGDPFVVIGTVLIMAENVAVAVIAVPHEQAVGVSVVVEVVDQVLRIAETVVTIEIARPENNDTITKTICLTDEERAISYLIETDD